MSLFQILEVRNLSIEGTLNRGGLLKKVPGFYSHLPGELVKYGHYLDYNTNSALRSPAKVGRFPRSFLAYVGIWDARRREPLAGQSPFLVLLPPRGKAFARRCATGASSTNRRVRPPTDGAFQGRWRIATGIGYRFISFHQCIGNPL